MCVSARNTGFSYREPDGFLQRAILTVSHVPCPAPLPIIATPANRLMLGYITTGGSRMRSVPLETAKQLDFKMKFMGLAVVFMVLNLLLSPTQSAPFVILVPAASTLPL